MTTLAPPSGFAAPPRRLWLISFVDLVMLMLAFFVLMFSMSRFDDDRFVEMARSYAQAFSALGGIDDVDAGPTRIPPAERNPGDSLVYLESVLKAAFSRDPDLDRVRFRLTAQYLILELPLAAAGEEGDTLDKATQQQVFKIGGVIGNLPNRVAVVVPGAGAPEAWDRARRQARTVRQALVGAGYTRPLTALVRGSDADPAGPARVQILVMPEVTSTMEASP